MFGRRALRVFLFIALFEVTPLSALLAQNEAKPPTDQATDTKPTDKPKKNPSLRSAHTTLRTFFDASKAQDWAEVAKCLDYSEMGLDRNFAKNASIV